MNAIENRALELLRASLNDQTALFHEHQWESISTLVEQRQRLLVVQRTGWGKSAVYFIATKLMREQDYGPTIIISPLLALMRNQIESAAKYGVCLGTINSSNTEEQNANTIVELANNQLDAIIISPEQLSKPSFVDNVLLPIADNVGLFVIDEAHCISDWGHDFRPDYKRIVNILPHLPVNMPVLATTATANQRVMNDVSNQLGEGIKVFRGKLTRDSLHLQNIAFPKRSQRLAWLADILPQLEGTGIIYVATIRDAEQVASWLQSRDLAVEAYYGSFQNLDRDASTARRLELEEALLNNEVKALVATPALGMGYDKPDLAFVIHYQSPGSVVGYYQQVGRAGRAIPNAYGVLLSGDEDDDIQQSFIQKAFPQEWLVERILEVLEEAKIQLGANDILQKVNGSNKKIEAALIFLCAESPAPVIKSQQRPIRFSRTLSDYQLPHEEIARLSELKENEWEVMQHYLYHKHCLMEFLSNELDDENAAPCGKCANCDPDAALPIEYKHETAVAAAELLENIFIEIEPRKQAGAAKFPIDQLPHNLTNEGLLHEPGRVLCRWGEAGWGEIAKDGKQAGQFDPRLVAASAKMILQRWNPDPLPTWVTFVPSHQHPELVANFAQALANNLGIPCIDAVKKIEKNKPQKFMENTDFRCKNLDGVFEIQPGFLNEPVLLVDDAVDSRWTFTVIAALLRRAGSGPVYPFAIMSTETNS